MSSKIGAPFLQNSAGIRSENLHRCAQAPGPAPLRTASRIGRQIRPYSPEKAILKVRTWQVHLLAPLATRARLRNAIGSGSDSFLVPVLADSWFSFWRIPDSGFGRFLVQILEDSWFRFRRIPGSDVGRFLAGAWKIPGSVLDGFLVQIFADLGQVFWHFWFTFREIPGSGCIDILVQVLLIF